MLCNTHDVTLCNTHDVTLCHSDQVSAVVQSLEENLQLLCVTGVEDQLQVRPGVWKVKGGWVRVGAWKMKGGWVESGAVEGEGKVG